MHTWINGLMLDVSGEIIYRAENSTEKKSPLTHLGPKEHVPFR